MKIEVQLTTERLHLPSHQESGCGAIASFAEIVRSLENGGLIRALVYEA